MADRWFRIPEAGSGTTSDPYRPDYVGGLDLDFAGNKSHPNGSPLWVVRVYGSTSELDTLAGKTGVTQFASCPSDPLNQMFGRAWTDSQWNAAFQVW